MTKDEFKQLAQREIEGRADELARANGIAQGRSFEELRFHAGFALGMLHASRMLDDVDVFNVDE